MWPRYCEIVLAAWLIVSPAVLKGPARVEAIAIASGMAMLVFSALALTERLRRMYLATLLVALAVAGYPFLEAPPVSPLTQNLMITGLIIAMFAIMPPEAMRPPRQWRQIDHR